MCVCMCVGCVVEECARQAISTSAAVLEDADVFVCL